MANIANNGPREFTFTKTNSKRTWKDEYNRPTSILLFFRGKDVSFNKGV